jgi:hypothetical protein
LRIGGWGIRDRECGKCGEWGEIGKKISFLVLFASCFLFVSYVLFVFLVFPVPYSLITLHPKQQFQVIPYLLVTPS